MSHRFGRFLAVVTLAAVMSTACNRRPAPFEVADRSPRDDKPAPFDPPNTYPGWAYDGPDHVQPTEALKPEPRVKKDDPLHYFTNKKVVMIRRPGGYVAEEIPRVALWWTDNNGFHWNKGGYLGRGMEYFPFEVEEDGDYGVRFVGPGQEPALHSLPYPERVYHVDTQPPEVTVAVEPEKSWYHVGETVTVSWSAEDYHLLEHPVSIGVLTDFTSDDHGLTPLQRDLADEGSITYEIPRTALDHEIRFRIDAYDRAGNLGLAISFALQVVEEELYADLGSASGMESDDPSTWEIHKTTEQSYQWQGEGQMVQPEEAVWSESGEYSGTVEMSGETPEPAPSTWTAPPADDETYDNGSIEEIYPEPEGGGGSAARPFPVEASRSAFALEPVDSTGDAVDGAASSTLNEPIAQGEWTDPTAAPNMVERFDPYADIPQVAPEPWSGDGEVAEPTDDCAPLGDAQSAAPLGEESEFVTVAPVDSMDGPQRSVIEVSEALPADVEIEPEQVAETPSLSAEDEDGRMSLDGPAENIAGEPEVEALSPRYTLGEPMSVFDPTEGNGLLVPLPATVSPGAVQAVVTGHPWRVLGDLVSAPLATIWSLPQPRYNRLWSDAVEGRFLADHPRLRAVAMPGRVEPSFASTDAADSEGGSQALP